MRASTEMEAPRREKILQLFKVKIKKNQLILMPFREKNTFTVPNSHEPSDVK